MLRTKNHGRRTADGGRRTDIWNTKSLPELSSGETKSEFTHLDQIWLRTSLELQWMKQMCARNVLISKLDLVQN